VFVLLINMQALSINSGVVLHMVSIVLIFAYRPALLFLSTVFLAYRAGKFSSSEVLVILDPQVNDMIACNLDPHVKDMWRSIYKSM
jgi:hypothetical protein